jgi:hypothetical protein
MDLSTEEDNRVSGHWIYALAHEMQGSPPMRSSVKECGKVRAVDAAQIVGTQ